MTHALTAPARVGAETSCRATNRTHGLASNARTPAPARGSPSGHHRAIRLFFDSNIYHRLDLQGGVEAIAARLAARDDVVHAASVIWEEQFRSPVEVRRRQFPMILRLAAERPPSSADLDAREVLAETRRLRPA